MLCRIGHATSTRLTDGADWVLRWKDVAAAPIRRLVSKRARARIPRAPAPSVGSAGKPGAPGGRNTTLGAAQVALHGRFSRRTISMFGRAVPSVGPGRRADW